MKTKRQMGTKGVNQDNGRGQTTQKKDRPEYV